MTPGRRRLVALSAALAPDRAARLLGWLGDPDGAACAASAAALSGAPRRARLAALAAALAGEAGPARLAGLEPRHPLLARLRREAAAGPRSGEAAARGWAEAPVEAVAAHPAVRAAAGLPPSGPREAL